MSTKQPANIPIALSTARHQLDCWRSRQRSKRARLPQELWQKAVALAREHGLNKTASVLGLKYYSLKKHIETTATNQLKPTEARCEFLELLPSSATAPSIDCTIGLENTGSTKMWMHVKGASMTDLASFACVFWSGRT